MGPRKGTTSRHVIRLGSSLVVAISLFVAAVAGGEQSGARSASPSSDVIDAARLIADLKTLSSDEMAGRKTGSAGAEMARRFVVERFREAGLEPIGSTFEHPFGASSPARTGAAVARGVNVVGRLAGKVTANRYLVVSAHYDHMGVRDGRVFNGANDNASGAASLAVIAAYFAKHRPAVSILFVAFDAEEESLTGSRAFVRAPPVPADSILANVNLDMIGRDASETLWVTGVRRFPGFERFVLPVAASAPIRIRIGHDDPAGRDGEDWTRDSDQFAFIEAGIPALYVGVEDYRYLHSPDDDFETMMPSFYVAAVESIVNLIAELDAGADAVARMRLRAR